jgi:hypothetical protein
MGLDAHKFYHKNFPTGDLIRGNFPLDVNYTFLKGTEFPTIIYTGNQSVKIPKALGAKIDRKFVKRVSKKGFRIYLYEPLCCYIKGKDYNNSFYSEFSAHDDLALIRSEELDSIQRFVDAYGFKNVRVYTCDYNVEKYLGPFYSFDIECKDLFLSDIKNALKDGFKHSKKIEKHFWCAIGRYTYPRHLIISYLANFPGNYAWHHTYKRDILECDTWLEKEKLTEPMCSLLEHGNRLINKNYYNIDIELDSRETVEHHHGVYIPQVNDLRSEKFLESYDKCFVAIVAETRYAQPTANISEKLLTCIGSKTPFILLAPPYSLEYARSLGFKTFSKFWSEKYDTIEDPTLRLKEIFDLIDKIGRMDVPQLEQMYSEMAEILEHNIAILNKLK